MLSTGAGARLAFVLLPLLALWTAVAWALS